MLPRDDKIKIATDSGTTWGDANTYVYADASSGVVSGDLAMYGLPDGTDWYELQETIRSLKSRVKELEARLDIKETQENIYF